MSLFGTSVEVKRLESEVKRLEAEVKTKSDELDRQKEKVAKLEFEKTCVERRAELSQEEAINKLRKEMDKRLIESDMARVEATAALKAYKEMDLKDLRNKIENMMEKLVAGLTQQSKVSIVK